MKKKIFTLIALLCTIVGGAKAEDAVTATQTFTSGRSVCTWTSLNVTVAKGKTAGGDGLYFTAGSEKAISTSSGTVQGGSGTIAVVYVEVPSATSSGQITMTSSTDASDRPMYLVSYDKTTNPGGKVVCSKTGSVANFTASDVVSFEGGYYVKMSNTDKKDVKIKSFIIELAGGETYPESVATDPVFSLTKTTISTVQTAQIQVGTRGNLDGIAFNGDVTYGTPGIVTVSATGVVTPVAAGTTTINFNTSAVAGKYNASTGNSLTITVTEAVTVFDAAGLTNAQILLTEANVESKDYLTCNSDTWQDKGWPEPYNGKFLDWKTNRKITLKVKNASKFELYVNGTSGRTYSIKVGDADAESYTQNGTGSGFVSSGVIATGTKDEVTIVIEGGSSTLYPVYFLINPVVEAAVDATYGWSTFVSDKALDFTGISDVKAYIVTGHTGTVVDMTQMTGSVPANTPLLLEGSTTVVPALVSSSTDVSANLLKAGTGADVAAEEGKTKYVLSANGGVATFLKINGTAATVPVGKAYLEFTGSVSASYLNLDDSGATGIKTLNMISADGSEVYNLSGQRVAQPTKGLYIVNGKKVIIK